MFPPNILNEAHQMLTEHKNKTVETLQQIPVQETKGLKSHEIALLILLMENTISKDDYISIYSLYRHHKEIELANYIKNLYFKLFNEHLN